MLNCLLYITAPGLLPNLLIHHNSKFLGGSEATKASPIIELKLIMVKLWKKFLYLCNVLQSLGHKDVGMEQERLTSYSYPIANSGEEVKCNSRTCSFLQQEWAKEALVVRSVTPKNMKQPSQACQKLLQNWNLLLTVCKHRQKNSLWGMPEHSDRSSVVMPVFAPGQSPLPYKLDLIHGSRENKAEEKCWSWRQQHEKAPPDIIAAQLFPFIPSIKNKEATVT